MPHASHEARTECIAGVFIFNTFLKKLITCSLELIIQLHGRKFKRRQGAPKGRPLLPLCLAHLSSEAQPAPSSSGPCWREVIPKPKHGLVKVTRRGGLSQLSSQPLRPTCKWKEEKTPVLSLSFFLTRYLKERSVFAGKQDPERAWAWAWARLQAMNVAPPHSGSVTLTNPYSSRGISVFVYKMMAMTSMTPRGSHIWRHLG